jgi:DNA-binding NarL/FixJ family response regulator
MTTSTGPVPVHPENEPGSWVCTIVICDDQPELRAAIVDILASKPKFLVVGHAEDGTTCLERVRETAPDLLILDVNMPGGGPHVAKGAKHIRPQLHIVVFSGREDAKIERAMLEAGADQYVLKTGRIGPLLHALQSAYLKLAERKILT